MGSSVADGTMGTLVNSTNRKTMFAAHLQRSSLVTLTRLSSASSSSALSRLFSSTSTQRQSNIPKGFAAIKEKQKYFNVDNGKRVHERGGGIDYALHTFTLLVLAVGAVEWFRVLYCLAYPGGFK